MVSKLAGQFKAAYRYIEIRLKGVPVFRVRVAFVNIYRVGLVLFSLSFIC